MKIGYLPVTVISVGETKKTTKGGKPYTPLKVQSPECSSFTCICWNENIPNVGEVVNAVVDMNTKDGYKISVRIQ